MLLKLKGLSGAWKNVSNRQPVYCLLFIVAADDVLHSCDAYGVRLEVLTASKDTTKSRLIRALFCD
jgi:hypothetical protein